MDINRRQPHRVFEKTKERYGEMMESYARHRQKPDHSETDFKKLEEIRQESRNKEEKRRIVFRFVTGLFALIFLYVFLRLVNSDIISILY
jgi:hypothetical protein